MADARGTPLLLAAAHARELIVVARLQAAAPATPLLFRAVLSALAAPDNLSEAEVRTLSDRALATWTRPAAEPTVEALRHVDDSDRRWLWAAALAVLLIEMWLRRDSQRGRGRARGRGDEAQEAHDHAA
jgi:hypothetical protein